MSAAVASRNSPHTPGGNTGAGAIHSTVHSGTAMDSKRIKQEGESGRLTPKELENMHNQCTSSVFVSLLHH